MKKLTFLVAMAFCFALSAMAINPYAYSVTTEQHGVVVDVTYKLNAPATAVALQFIENDVVVASVPLDGLAKGENVATAEMPSTLVPGTEYEMALAVTNAAHGFEVYRNTSLTSDNRMHAFVNNVPTSPEFGEIYIGYRPATAANRCYYKANPEYEINNTKWNPYVSPYATSSVGRGCMVSNGLALFAEYGDASSGIWVYNTENGKKNQFFKGTRNSLGLFIGDDSAQQGCSAPGIGIYEAGANTKLYMVGEDFGNSDKKPFHLAIYNIGHLDGSIDTTWSSAPSKLIEIADGDGGNFAVAATKYGAFLCQHRAKGVNTTGMRALMFYSNDGIRKYVSNQVPDVFNGAVGGGVVYDEENEKLYTTNGDGNLLQFSIEWAADSTPTLTKDTMYTLSTAAIGQMSFDYAHNIIATTGAGYATSGANMALTVFSLPTAAPTTVTTPVTGTATYVAPIEHLYEIGTNQAGGWNPNVGTGLANVSGNVFKYEVEITGETYFAFVTELNSSWDYVNARRYGPSENNTVVANGDNVDLVKDDGTGTKAFKITAAGFYTIIVDLNRMKMAVTSVPAKVEIMQGWDNWAPVLMTNDDGVTCTATIALEPGDYSGNENGFKVRINDNTIWYGVFDIFKRKMGAANRTKVLNSASDNAGLWADVPGDYIFTYKYATGEMTVTWPESFTRTAEIGDYQTLCVPFTAYVTGAEVYEIKASDIHSGYVTLTAAAAELHAGYSYILKATATTINIYMPGGTVQYEPIQPGGGATGLYGALSVSYLYKYDTETSWRSNYVLQSDNKFHEVQEHGEVTINSTRAYLHIAGGANAPELRIIEAGNEATNIENVEANEQAVKFIQNGQMFIKKNGVVYDMMGHIVR